MHKQIKVISPFCTFYYCANFDAQRLLSEATSINSVLRPGWTSKPRVRRGMVVLSKCALHGFFSDVFPSCNQTPSTSTSRIVLARMRKIDVCHRKAGGNLNPKFWPHLFECNLDSHISSVECWQAIDAPNSF